MGGAAQLRGVTVGAGRAKIAASLCAASPPALLEEADRLVAAGADIAEWRVDHLLEADPKAPVGQVPAALRPRLGELPLIVTLRSAREGGRVELDDARYADAVTAALQHGGADAVDLELARADVLTGLVGAAREAGARVVVSHHDLTGTPSAEQIVDRLAAMVDVGADVAKVAVTAHGPDDLLVLLTATRTAAQRLPVPVVTMAMGPVGLVSRLCGEVFGSSITFGALDAPSAPGQIDIARLRDVVGLVHEYGTGGPAAGAPSAARDDDG